LAAARRSGDLPILARLIKALGSGLIDADISSTGNWTSALVGADGKKGAKTKPLTGPKEFRGAKVLEIVSDDGPNTYRGVYTIEFEEAVYLLAAFQKKSKRGIATPQQDIDKIVDRIKRLHRDRDTPEGNAVIAVLLQRKAARRTEIDRQKELKNDPKRK
jgi:phage-related protein